MRGKDKSPQKSVRISTIHTVFVIYSLCLFIQYSFFVAQQQVGNLLHINAFTWFIDKNSHKNVNNNFNYLITNTVCSHVNSFVQLSQNSNL